MDNEELKNIIKQSIQETISKEIKATLTILECSKYTGIGKDKLLALAHNINSDFPCFRVGKKYLINRDLLNKWLEKISLERRIL